MIVKSSRISPAQEFLNESLEKIKDPLERLQHLLGEVGLQNIEVKEDQGWKLVRPTERREHFFSMLLAKVTIGTGKQFVLSENLLSTQGQGVESREFLRRCCCQLLTEIVGDGCVMVEES